MSSMEMIEEWFYEYNQDIYNFLIYYVGSTDVEDMLQEVFIRALKGIHTFRGESSPKTWLFSITRNVAVDMKRKEQRHLRKLNLFQEAAGDEIVHSRTPEEVYEIAEKRSEIINGIHSLKQSYQDVLFLRALKDFSVEETAEILGWRQNKVSVTYHRAIKALRSALEKGGGVFSE
ncbi:RNA polymerase sigma factor [Falsibacillus albus]|uniref:RNA polymerase sigma factor n=1 Tax=Falsibacillus albus TaxID=2478915 RepID=A0A3L7JUE1_9BACI|nr:RNA polymerase sigma factor [Falsibacillus albus]RLQ94356.1 RNA polymerase sigma factor [Falsibacillus albus]